MTYLCKNGAQNLLIGVQNCVKFSENYRVNNITCEKDTQISFFDDIGFVQDGAQNSESVLQNVLEKLVLAK